MPTLNWIGKDAVVNHHKEVPFRLLKPIDKLSVIPKTSEVSETSEVCLSYGATHTTRVNDVFLYSPLISQQPSVGISTPVSMASPISSAMAFVAP